MARRKLCASTTFEILRTFNLYTEAAKSYMSKGIQTIFEIFAWARRCLGRAIGWKVSSARVFYFCNGKVKTLCINNIWNFATFNLFTVPAKIPYLQKYSTDIRNLCLRSKMLRVGIWVESVRCAGILLLQWKGENFEHRKHLKFCHFQPCTLCQQKSIYLQWYSTDFRNLSPRLEDVEGGAFGWKRFSCAGILLLQWQGEKFAHRQHLKFCRFQPVHCGEQKSYISKSIQPIFEIFAWARRCWGWAFGWTVLGAQVFYFCNRKAKTLGIDNIWNFATFNL